MTPKRGKGVSTDAIARALRALEQTEDADTVRRYMANARRANATAVYDAAFKKLVSLLPQEAPGSLEYAFWQTLHAFEEMLTEERGKTARLARTRQKVQRVGVKETLMGFATHPTSTQGFDMLIERGLPELTGEAIVIRHKSEFPEEVVRAATNRLKRAGVDVEALPKA